eukprot:m.131307 g.131307  ORF g.131307 m.131307 type:complete len:437 (+) comp29536_c0_seq1:14-1324(+)
MSRKLLKGVAVFVGLYITYITLLLDSPQAKPISTAGHHLKEEVAGHGSDIQKTHTRNKLPSIKRATQQSPPVPVPVSDRQTPMSVHVIDPRPCSEDEANFQEKYFSAFADMGRRLGCVADRWEELIAKAMPDAATFIDIGMNKGYSSSNFFALWASEKKFTAKSVHRVMIQDPDFPGSKACGACHDCNQVYQVPSNIKEHSIRVFGYEPGLKNLELCEKVRTTNPQIKDDWILHRVAVSDRPGHDTFPESSDETGHLGGKGVDTEITTLDLILEENNLNYVDLIKIDTEGFDAPALAGGTSTFLNHRVGVVLFEYHKLTRWWEFSLESVVQVLDEAGYTCFLAGKDHVLRLTSCWKPMMEFKWWSNIMCASRVKSAAVVEVLDEHSFRKLGKKQFDGKPASSMEKGFNSKYVYGAPPWFSLPQNTGGNVTKFAWAV